MYKYIHVLRPHHWVKNLVLFVPNLILNRWYDFHNLFFGILSFSLVASLGYIFNDWKDRFADEQHPQKRLRPIANRSLSPLQLLSISFSLVVSILILGSRVSSDFQIYLIIYVLITFCYSWLLKKIPIIDVITLTTLFCLRIFAGGTLSHILITPWLIFYSIFFFLCLALSKRVASLAHTSTGSATANAYNFIHMNKLVTSGYLSFTIYSLIMFFYILSQEASTTFSNPKFIWPCFICLSLWSLILWNNIIKNRINDDFYAYALKDWKSYLCLLIVLLSVYLAHHT